MPNIPQTNKDVEDMLSTIGIDNIDKLFEIIPSKYRYDIESGEYFHPSLNSTGIQFLRCDGWCNFHQLMHRTNEVKRFAIYSTYETRIEKTSLAQLPKAIAKFFLAKCMGSRVDLQQPCDASCFNSTVFKEINNSYEEMNKQNRKPVMPSRNPNFKKYIQRNRKSQRAGSLG